MSSLSDCTRCKKLNNSDTRQAMGCGYEPALPAEKLQPLWLPQGFRPPEPNEDGEPVQFPTVCPGYTVRLPEVIEIARARMHWLKGELSNFCDDKPVEMLMIGIEIMDASATDLHNAHMTPQSAGGLAKD